jgi:hypothetical protein
MPQKSSCLLLIPLLCLPLVARATTIHRCDAPDGRITFTTMSCAAGEHLSTQQVQTYLPGTPVTLMPEASHREIPGRKFTNRDPTIIGQPEHKCGNLISARERREAIINQRIVAGMSQQDVESALGKPDKISIRNSTTSYRYDTKRGRSANVEFDAKGCTKGKAKSQTAKSPH